MDIVNIIRCNKTDVVLLGKVTQRSVDGLFLGQPVILNLKEKIILPKDLHIFANQSIRPFTVPAQNRLRNLPCHTGR